MKNFRKLSIVAALATAITFTANCSILNPSDDDDDQSLAAAALVLLGQGCTVGASAFTAAGVTCSGGMATGTGTMFSTAAHGDDFSIQLDYTLGTGGTMYVLSGLTGTTIDSNSGSGMYITTTAINGVRPTNVAGSATGLTAPGTSSASLCLEIHYDESPDHIIANAAACPTGTVNTSTASFESEATAVSGTSDVTGTNWGFILNNATITNITVNATNKFVE